MGEARMKLLREGEPLEFDFAAPEMHVVRADRAVLSRVENGGCPDESRVMPRATRATISSVVQAAFPQGMDRKDGKVWAAWLELLDDNDVGDQAKVTRGEARLRRLARLGGRPYHRCTK